MNEIQEFCRKRKIPKNIRDSFIAYCRGSISDDYDIGNGKTVTGILTNFTEVEVEKMWLEFVRELKSTLETNDLEVRNNE